MLERYEEERMTFDTHTILLTLCIQFVFYIVTSANTLDSSSWNTDFAISILREEQSIYEKLMETSKDASLAVYGETNLPDDSFFWQFLETTNTSLSFFHDLIEETISNLTIRHQFNTSQTVVTSYSDESQIDIYDYDLSSPLRLQSIAVEVLALEASIDRLHSNAVGAYERVTLNTKSKLSSLLRNLRVYQQEFEQERGQMIESKLVAEIENRKDLEGASTKVNLHDKKDYDLWVDGGYTILDDMRSIDAREFVQKVELESYRLRDDTKKEIILASSENFVARTRKHIKAKEMNSTSNFKDITSSESSYFHLNIASFQSILSDVERLEIQFKVLHDVLHSFDGPTSTLDALKDLVENSPNFASFSDLANRVAAIETNSTVNRLFQKVEFLRHLMRNAALKNLYTKQLDLHDKDERTKMKIAQATTERKVTEMQEDFTMEYFLHVFMNILESTNSISTLTDLTFRDVVQAVRNKKIKISNKINMINADRDEERKSEYFSIEKIKLIGDETQKTIIKAVEVIFLNFTNGLVHGLTHSDGRRQVICMVLFLSALVFFLSFAKEANELMFCVLVKCWLMPRLVREKGNCSIFPMRPKKELLKDIILPPEEKRRIDTIFDATVQKNNFKKHKENLLIVGKSGTGKSIMAKVLAQACGLPFAIMSGADIAPLGSTGSLELRKTLEWVQKNEGILVIDDAESCFSSRIRIQSRDLDTERLDARDALNVFLSMTGDTSGKMMIILTTSNPGSLDEAILDRMDNMISCELPTRQQRYDIINIELTRKIQYQQQRKTCGIFQRRRRIQLAGDFEKSRAIEYLSSNEKTNGFSGRELGQIVRAVATSVYIDEDNTLSHEIWNKTVDEMCISIKAKKNLKTKA